MESDVARRDAVAEMSARSETGFTDPQPERGASGARGPHVAVLFHRLGPYHVARLAAAAAHARVTALEMSEETREYAWTKVDDASGFDRVTLAPGADLRDLPRQEADRRIIETLDRLRPDAVAVHGYAERDALLALQWCLRTETPAILMSESTAWDFPRHPFKEWAKGQVVRAFQSALVGGHPHADYVVELGLPRERVALGYDAIDNAYFVDGADVVREDAARWRTRLGLERPFFLASNRFIPKKNLARLLDAYAGYRERAGEAAWDLVLLGDGELRDQVEAQRARLGLQDVVHLPGFKQYDELPAYYGLAGAFVHASTTEQWGLVVNEAMAAGLPVLVSERCGCAADLVHDGVNGFAFDPYDVERLTELLAEVADGQADRDAMGAAGRAIVAEWGPERFARGLSEATRAALTAPRPRRRWRKHLVLTALTAR